MAPTSAIINQEFWVNIHSLIDMLYKEITKMSIAYSEPPKPKCPDAKGIFDGATKVLLALVSSLYKIHGSCQGKLLERTWHAGILRLFKTIQEYSQVLVSGYGLSQQTGSVWESCDFIKALPKDNKSCLVKYIKEQSALVADALSELQEAIDSCNNGDDYEETVVTEFHLFVLQAGSGLVKATKIFLHKIRKTVEAHGHADTMEQVADLDKLCSRLAMTSEVIDDFSASLYPPCDRDDVRINLTPLGEHLEVLMQEVRESHICVGVDSDWTNVIENGICHNRTKIESLVT